MAQTIQERRLETLIAQLPQELDAALISSEVGRMYFTGMRSSAGTLFVTREGAWLVIDSRYFEKAKQSVHGCEVLLQGKLYEQLETLGKKQQVRRVGIEADYLNLAEYARLCERLPAWEIAMDGRLSGLIRGMRMLKSDEEIACIKAAQQITDAAFTHICGYIRAGMTDRQVAGELLHFCYQNGSERPAFDYIVVSGSHSSMPHGVPTDKVIERGDFLTMDFGCVSGGYCSDMTRTVAIGQVSDEQRRVYETVGAAQRAAIAAVKPGVACAAVDAAAREIIAAAGWGDCFGHGTGHSLGLEIHESPSAGPASEAVCAAGMILTVEPGIYLAGRFGVRTEDMVLVTEDGCVDFTASERELRVL